LERLGVPFEILAVEVPERECGEPAEVALHNALAKARAAQLACTGRPGARELPILGVDTVVAHGGELFGKPASAAHARDTLLALGGATHEVLSGVALIDAEGVERTAVARTQVRFRALSEALVDWYVACGEWRERAGGYAIQGRGAALVLEIHGDYENVVGLPVATLLELWPGLLARVN
jgi:septum formation protein